MSKFYGATSLIGGATGALDKFDGAGLSDLDGAFALTNGILIPYWLDEDSGVAEDSPRSIMPNTNPGDKRWLQAGISVRDVIAGGPLVDVRLYGAHSILETGYETFDSTTAIQAAIDYVEATVAAGIGGGIVLLPMGVWLVSNLVVNTSNVKLTGCGWRVTYIKAKAGTTGSIVTFDGTDYANYISYNGIRNLAIWGNDTSTKGLSLKHLSTFRVDQVNIVGCLDDGSFLEQVWDATFIQFKVNNCGADGKAAIHIYNGGETYCDQLNFYAPYIEGNTGYDIWVDASNAAGMANSNILFHRMHLERTTGTGETLVYVSGTKGNSSIMFTSCVLSGFDADDAIHCDAGGATQLRITGCTLWNRGDRGTALLLETGRHIVDGNYFSQWDYDIDYQSLTYPADLYMSNNRRIGDATGRIAVIGPSTVWSWSKQSDSHETIAFTDGDTTPSVAQGRVFYTNNTSPTTYTMLDDGSEGETITIYFWDNLTTFTFSSGNMHGNGGVNFTGAQYDHMTCLYSGGHWFCNVSDNT